ncbi:MAG: 7TM diverse intracellular signaling domain-containing protein [Niastella sp.]|uniref:7TM diverse intracellular signaling domain-containing protein n=1 Tax=Niastella sp. TaxID=1869183 RepID=UPI00389A81C4
MRSCQLRIFPGMANRLYYFDANAREWLMEEAGMMPGRDNGRINRRGMACILRADTINTVYVHIDLKHLGAFAEAFKPDIRLETAAFASKQDQLVWITWITSLAIVLLFLLNNVYIYFSFKDKAVLYYLIGQLGGLIYMTAHKQLFPAFFPDLVFTTGLQPNGKAAWFGLNDLLLHTGILVVIYSIVQFSRSYLNTRQSLPRLDVMLRWGMRAYLLLSFIFVFINTGFYYIEPYAWMMDNALPVFLFVAILYAGVAGYRRQLPAARPFLVANVVSVGCMLAIPLYHLIMDVTGMGNPFIRSLLPDLVSITQTFGFSVALVARMRSVEQELIAKEREASRLESDLREITFRHQLIEQDKQKIITEIQLEKTRNVQLQEKMEANQRELTASSLNLVQKNDLLIKLQTQIKELKKIYPGKSKQELQGIESLLQTNQFLDAGWDKFTLHFEQVHPHFFENLKAKHPTLTKNEVRLYAYLHLNLSTKEIGAMLHIDPASVRRAKSRLYKKMGINTSDKAGEEENA